MLYIFSGNTLFSEVFFWVRYPHTLFISLNLSIAVSLKVDYKSLTFTSSSQCLGFPTIREDSYLPKDVI